MSGPAPVPGPRQDAAGQAVADVLRRLDELHERPLTEHVEVFDGVHRALQDALTRLDEV